MVGIVNKLKVIVLLIGLLGSLNINICDVLEVFFVWVFSVVKVRGFLGFISICKELI